MSRPLPLAAVCMAVFAAALGGCGEKISVPAEQADLRRGAVLFQERCSGCHTIDSAASRGSKPEGQVGGGERTNGPNFNTRKESAEDVLFAIRNGGFSGAIMPANIVVGEEAELVAKYLERYSGSKEGEADASSEQSQQGRGTSGGP